MPITGKASLELSEFPRTQKACRWPCLLTLQVFPTHPLNSLLYNAMASKSFKQALNSPAVRQLTSSTVQRRTFVTALSKARVGAPVPVRASGIGATQQIRGIKNIDFAGAKENVWGMVHVATRQTIC